jgi:hypothetical protein
MYLAAVDVWRAPGMILGCCGVPAWHFIGADPIWAQSMFSADPIWAPPVCLPCSTREQQRVRIEAAILSASSDSARFGRRIAFHVQRGSRVWSQRKRDARGGGGPSIDVTRTAGLEIWLPLTARKEVNGWTFRGLRARRFGFLPLMTRAREEMRLLPSEDCGFGVLASIDGAAGGGDGGRDGAGVG